MIVVRILDPRSKLATARELDEETSTSTLAEMLEVQQTDGQALYTAAPLSSKFSADKISEYMKERKPTQFGGCFMCHGLFIKVDRSMGCSCQIGYYADLGDRGQIDVGHFVNGPLLRYIRDSFKDGCELFQMCGSCVSRTIKYPEIDLDQEVFLHVEPSNGCNL